MLTHIGDYTDLTQVGAGSHAEVYTATDPATGQQVAIKRILPSPSNNRISRFMREARLLMHLDHPFIVTVYDVAVDDDGVPYIVMDYHDGPLLSDYLKQQGRIPLNEALLYFEPLAAALDYIHTQNIIHRDVKGANIALVLDAPRPHAILMDFGLAKRINEESDTHSGIVGTLAYMAPELIQYSAPLTTAVDIYSFGALLFEALTGQQPFRRENNNATMLAHMTEHPPDPRDLVPGLPPQVTTVLHTALAKDPAERYPTARMCVNALR